MNTQTHYITTLFLGEYTTPLELSKKLTEGISDNGNYLIISEDIQSETMVELFDRNIIDHSIEERIKETYSLNEYTIDESVLRITLVWSDETIKEQMVNQIVNTAYEIAIDTIDNASGDDEYYDYAPGYAGTLSELIAPFNKELSDKILERINEMED